MSLGTVCFPPMLRRSTRRLRSVLIVGALCVGPMGASPAPVEGQGVGPAVLGAAGGVLVGGYTTLAIYVTKARFGRYFFSPDELLEFSPATIPAAPS